MDYPFKHIQGDIQTVELPENYYDGCLCDPPYGIKFMGKDWDHGVPGKAMDVR